MKTKRLSCIRLNNGRLWFEAYEKNGRFVLDWKGAAKAALSNKGKLLTFTQNKKAEKLSVNIVRNMVRAYCNSLQGKESLHATALERNGKAIALCGESGAGKSTLAAYLLTTDNPWQIITDDVAYLTIDKNGVFIKPPEVSYIKLGKRTAARFLETMQDSNCKTQNLTKIKYDPHLQKDILFFENEFKSSREIPLIGIYQLCRKERLKRARLEKLKGAKASLFLLSNIYNEVLRPPGALQRQFYFCVQLAQNVPLYHFIYPHGLSRLQEAKRIFNHS